MTITTGGQKFEKLKWVLKLAPKGSDHVGGYVSGPFTILAQPTKKRGVVFYNVFVSTSDNPAKRLGAGSTLEEAKEIADAHAYHAFAFGPRPVTVTP